MEEMRSPIEGGAKPLGLVRVGQAAKPWIAESRRRYEGQCWQEPPTEGFHLSMSERLIGETPVRDLAAYRSIFKGGRLCRRGTFAGYAGAKFPIFLTQHAFHIAIARSVWYDVGSAHLQHCLSLCCSHAVALARKLRSRGARFRLTGPSDSGNLSVCVFCVSLPRAHGGTRDAFSLREGEHGPLP